MANNIVAMIAPVHYPKLLSLKAFIDSYNKISPDIDLYIAISEEESGKINEYANFISKDHMIIVPNVNSSKNPVTYKKMFALHELHKTKKYVGYAIVDIECDFVNSGFEDSFYRFYNSREIVCYPTDVDFLVNIQKHSSRFFKENDELIKFKKLFSVWNTIPWYIDQYLGSYFDDVKYNEGTFFNCEWEVFDSLAFQAWLISRGLYTISNTEYRLEYPEDMPTHKRDIFKTIKLDWVRKGAKNLPCFEGQKPLMYFHTDRD